MEGGSLAEATAGSLRVTPPTRVVRRERALVRAAQRGDAAALEALFRAHWPATYRAAWFIVRDAQAAEDIAQEAFLAAVAALDRLHRPRPLRPWPRPIVAPPAIHAVRARSLRREAGGDAPAAAALAGAACALAAAAAFSPPGEAVAEWVGRTVRDVVAPPKPRPAGLATLPGGGRILLLASGAPHIAGDRGRRQLLGEVGEATWSGHGRFVAAARGRQLIAVDLTGRRRWSIAARAPVRGPRWSP